MIQSTQAEEKPLIFSELEVGQHFISCPISGNAICEGLRKPHLVFEKIAPVTPANFFHSTQTFNARGVGKSDFVVSFMPDDMPVILIYQPPAGV